jgi:2-oxo-4-hydroxy-4-carboxy-5-ureidoimidazoline decarboxylase
MRIADLNGFSREEFVRTVGYVFEDSPWVAERAWEQRPFASLEALSECMDRVVSGASHAEQLALLRAHPDLGTRARIGESSTREQAGAGLDRLSPDEYALLMRLNTEYKEKFGFPFLYAVKRSGKGQILSALESRVASSKEEELAEALRQVFRIARFRLEEIIE